MKDNNASQGIQLTGKDFAIGLLSTTATILLVGILLLNNQIESAVAGPMTENTGEYVVTVATKTQNDEEVLFVVNVPTEKMIAYRFDTARQTIEILNGMDHGTLKNQAGQNQNQNQRGRGYRRP